MIRTTYWVIYFIIRLFMTIPVLAKLKYLAKKGKDVEVQKLVDKTAKTLATKLFIASGSSITVKGEENIPEDGAVLFVCNHLSNFDVIALVGYIKKSMSFIAKNELRHFPIFTNWMRYMNCVFIDRGNPRKSLLAINKGISILKQGHSMVIFPEGTRSDDTTLQAFKPGSLKLAMKAKVPIIPVTIKGTNDIMPKNKFVIRSAKVEIIVSPPIEVEDITGLISSDIAGVVRNTISENLK